MPWLRRTIRLFELARDLGLTNKDTFQLAVSLGIRVRSHSSTIEFAQADRIRRKAERDRLVHSGADPQSSSSEAEPATAAGQTPTESTIEQRSVEAATRAVDRVQGGSRDVSDFDTVVIDGSNVGRQGRPNKPPCDLALLLRCVEDLRKRGVGDVICIVDASETAPSSNVRDQVAAAVAEGWLQVAPSGVHGGADVFVLQTADALEAALVSWDGFRSYVERFPWLQVGDRLFSAKELRHGQFIFTGRAIPANRAPDV